MFIWSERFETHVEIIDKQHKKLVAILNDLCIATNSNDLNVEHLETILNELVDYADKHFTDEQQLMEEGHLYDKHIRIHKMEHQSFIYDIRKLSNYFCPDGDTSETAEALVKFITAWLTYHILGIDKVMVAQLEMIKQGVSPKKAYKAHKKPEYDAVTTRILLDAVLEMWKESNKHCHRLEQEIVKLKKH